MQIHPAAGCRGYKRERERRKFIYFLGVRACVLCTRFLYLFSRLPRQFQASVAGRAQVNTHTEVKNKGVQRNFHFFLFFFHFLHTAFVIVKLYDFAWNWIKYLLIKIQPQFVLIFRLEDVQAVCFLFSAPLERAKGKCLTPLSSRFHSTAITVRCGSILISRVRTAANWMDDRCLLPGCFISSKEHEDRKNPRRGVVKVGRLVRFKHTQSVCKYECGYNGVEYRKPKPVFHLSR